MGITGSNLSPQLSADKIFLSVKCLNNNNNDDNDDDDDEEYLSRLCQGALWEYDEMMFTLLLDVVLVVSHFCDKILDITSKMEEGCIVAHSFKWVGPSWGGDAATVHITVERK